MSPAALDTVLGKLARQHDPNVLVGFDHADDAGVYQLTPDQALVQTVDFFTPIVDDPYTFGQIAATNSLSDVYAMGGRPLTALALVCFPDKADLAILERILAGGLSKMIEANCTVIGGHSIRDEETKFGYSITGVIHPKKIYQNAGAKPGDKLILTKALGTGVISTAIKKAKAEPPWIDAAVASMTTLNKKAAEVITTARVGTDAFVRPVEQSSTAHSHPALRTQPSPKAGSRKPKAGFAVHAMTDITGFGLIGHLREILLASEVSATISTAKIPILEGALACIHAAHIPGGLNNNRAFAECLVEYAPEVPEDLRTILYDPQTAGGLLICTPEGDALTHALNQAGVPAVQIGEVFPLAKPRILVTK
ncbi:MAG TPA: selenide, water dikinase SelD [Candidatus Dormibacteraeota bacterium]|nr:selenide, water dikinase SelD [Candidatus Dormibacteraeota bacterium]